MRYGRRHPDPTLYICHSDLYLLSVSPTLSDWPKREKLTAKMASVPVVSAVQSLLTEAMLSLIEIWLSGCVAEILFFSSLKSGRSVRIRNSSFDVDDYNPCGMLENVAPVPFNG